MKNKYYSHPIYKPDKEESRELMRQIKNNKPKAAESVTVSGRQVIYALINDDGTSHCAWCRKPVSEIKDINDHLTRHDEREKVLREVREKFQDLVHPEFCAHRDKKYKQCAKCYIDDVLTLLEKIGGRK